MSEAPIPQFSVSDEQYRALTPAMRALANSDDVVRMSRGLAMSEGFAFHMVGCETPLVAQALILCLATQVRKLRGAPLKMTRLIPTRAVDAPLDPQGLGREVFDRLFLPDAEPRVICLDATDSRSDDRDAWLWLFQRLNERRNHLYAIKAPLLFLLPFDLSVELTRFAPDLWSIRGMGIRLLGKQSDEPVVLRPLAAMDDPVDRGIVDTNIQRLEASVEELLGQPGPHAKRALLVETRRLVTALQERGEGKRGLDLLLDRVLPVVRSSSRKLFSELMFDVVETLVRIGEAEQAERLAREEALPALEQAGNQKAVAALLSRLGDAYRGSGVPERALEILRSEALPRAEELDEPDFKAEVLSKVILTLLGQGELDQARELLSLNGALLASWLEPAKNMVVHLTLAHALLAHGDADAALHELKEHVLPLSRSAGAPAEALAWTTLGQAHRNRGELQEAISVWRGKALPIYRRQGRPASVAMLQGFIAAAKIQLGDREGGLQLMRESARDQVKWPASTIRDALDRRDAIQQLARLLAQHGAFEEAQQLLREALDDASPIWNQTKGGLEPLLEELSTSRAVIQPRSLTMQTEAGPEIYEAERGG